MNKPYVICHMLTSLDGKTTGSFLNTQETTLAIEAYEVVNNRYQAQAYLTGRTSIEESFTHFVPPEFEENPHQYSRDDYVAVAHAPAYMVVIDTSGKIGWQSNTLKYMERPEAHIIEVLTEKASNNYVAYLRKHRISYIFAGKEALNCTLALDKLRQLFNIEKLMLSGGARTNGYFLREGLIDELSIVLAPVVEIERHSLGIFEQNEDVPVTAPVGFKLDDVDTLPGYCLWLRYTK
ncbi:RibD family protein [Serratia marcescens]|uniref:RibD family protein n=1 Tax=Serratia marcescens TaxID=615 RepID=UPI00285362E8|nr:RibD family protein [Serratia marcescens]MDR4885902.1 RibD family protein [Serratia marcescens]